MELVERLRKAANLLAYDCPHHALAVTEAADLLEEALKALEFYGYEDGYEVKIDLSEGCSVTAGEVVKECGKRARAILTKSQGEKIDG